MLIDRYFISDALIMDSAPRLPDVKYQMDENLDLTPVQKFYKDANIFITGSTGFLGKILLDKLLRSCPGISTLYLLVRTKKGKSMHTRIDEIFDDIIFDRMKKECPKFRHKIVGITGDCSLENLGMTLEDRKELIDKVGQAFPCLKVFYFLAKVFCSENIMCDILHVPLPIDHENSSDILSIVCGVSIGKTSAAI